MFAIICAVDSTILYLLAFCLTVFFLFLGIIIVLKLQDMVYCISNTQYHLSIIISSFKLLFVNYAFISVLTILVLGDDLTKFASTDYNLLE